MKKLLVLIGIGAAVFLIADFESDEDPDHEEPAPVAKREHRKPGERCRHDCQCHSRECKKFRCVRRTRPVLGKGQKCIFDGDCRSCECHKFVCVEKK